LLTIIDDDDDDDANDIAVKIPLGDPSERRHEETTQSECK